jgi:hypothetical protein
MRVERSGERDGVMAAGTMLLVSKRWLRMGSISIEEVFLLGHQLCDPSISSRDTSPRSKTTPEAIKFNAWAVKMAHCGSRFLLHASLAGWYADHIHKSIVRQAETSL